MFFQKANPHHDRRTGRFTHAPGGSMVGSPVDSSGYRPAKRSIVDRNGVLDEEFTIEIADALIKYEDSGGLGYPPGTFHDPKLSVCREAQGFNGKPKILPDADFEGYAGYKSVHNEAPFEVLYRGDKDVSHIEEMRSGQFFPGMGLAGNGTYTSGDRELAYQYSMQGSYRYGGVQRMKLHPEARVLGPSFPDAGAWTTRKNNVARQMDSLAQRGRITPRQHEALIGLLADNGRAATLMGYDAIEVPKDITIILNRTAVVISETYN